MTDSYYPSRRDFPARRDGATVEASFAAAVHAHGQQHNDIPAELHYEASNPYAITLVFPADGLVWRFARDLLADGCRHAAGIGDVHIWTAFGQVHIRLAGSDHVAVVQLPLSEVRSFLRASWRLVPRGRERIDIDAALADLFEGGMSC